MGVTQFKELALRIDNAAIRGYAELETDPVTTEINADQPPLPVLQEVASI